MKRRKRTSNSDAITIDDPMPCPALWREIPRGNVERLGETPQETDKAEGEIVVDFAVDCYV